MAWSIISASHDGVYKQQQITVTHWGREKTAAISQTTFWNAFSWMKMYEFCIRFHWIVFPRIQLTSIPTLVQIIAWRRPGDKQLSEPMMVSLLTHICITQPQWVKQMIYHYQYVFNDSPLFAPLTLHAGLMVYGFYIIAQFFCKIHVIAGDIFFFWNYGIHDRDNFTHIRYKQYHVLGMIPECVK